jgi:hypothetical protein
MSLLMLRETPSSPAASSFDIPGIATLSGALFLLIWGLIKDPDYGWGSARTLAAVTPRRRSPADVDEAVARRLGRSRR